MNLKLTKTKYELERANRWTQFSMIVIYFNNRIHSDKHEIGFFKEAPEKNSDLYTYYGNTDHIRVACPAFTGLMNKNIEVVLKIKNNHIKKNELH